MTNRRALCVGINKFKNYPANGLNGCVNDCHEMASIVKEFLGFADSDITELIDEQATKTNIMSNLRSMVEDTKSGKYSYLVFSLSSHGTQVPDTSGDEPDGADEAFCPYDLAAKGDRWDTEHVIVDDELRDLFVQLPKNVLLEVFLDTCHSGTGIKGIDLLLDRKIRYMPPPSFNAFKELEGLRYTRMYEEILKKGTGNNILWAACRDDQTSSDAYIDGSYHGAFTYYLCKELHKTRNELSRSELLKKVRTDLFPSYNQVPQLECESVFIKGPIGSR